MSIDKHHRAHIWITIMWGGEGYLEKRKVRKIQENFRKYFRPLVHDFLICLLSKIEKILKIVKYRIMSLYVVIFLCVESCYMTV